VSEIIYAKTEKNALVIQGCLPI